MATNFIDKISEKQSEKNCRVIVQLSLGKSFKIPTKLMFKVEIGFCDRKLQSEYVRI